MLLPPRSGAVVAWGNALLAGTCGPDDADAAIVGPDAAHRILGIPGERGAVSWAWALAALRAGGATGFRLVLPVPGDPRGLPGPAGANAAALAAGEAVLVPGRTPLLVVPADLPPARTEPGEPGPPPAAPTGQAGRSVAHALSPATTTRTAGMASMRWDCLPAATAAGQRPAGSDPGALRSAEVALRIALREAAAELGALGLDRARPDAVRRLDRIERAAGAMPLPPSLPPSAVALLRSAVRAAAIVQLAGEDDGAAVSAAEAARRRAALAPVADAARGALVAAYGAGAP